MDKKNMTPLAVQMLLHYWCCNEQFPNQTSQAQREAIRYFEKMGLVSIDPATNVVTPNRDALNPYIEAVLAVPLPIQKWVLG